MSLPQERRYTYADMLDWDTDVRYELYDGWPVALASPTHIHQAVLTALLGELYGYLKGKRCRVYPAPFDVRPFEEEGDDPQNVDVVVQPDLMVVCDPRKVDRRGVHGAPELVIEILSESTRRNDRLTKFNLYQQAGVQEYWIVDTDSKVVSVYTLEDGAYHAAETYGADARVPVGVLEDCSIDLTAVFLEE